MKVVFISNGLTHYYNLVLSKLNRESDVELILIVPALISDNIGKGVYQTREGVDFKVIELEERRKLGLYTTFKGLATTLTKENPDIVIVGDIHLWAFLLNFSVICAMKKIRAGLILKSIPFRYISYDHARKEISEERGGFARLPRVINRLMIASGMIKITKRLLLNIKKKAFNLPDAHVNYVEAYDYWASYGIGREKIFITRNSPDTDLLFGVKESLKNVPLILPFNRFRLLHVGRLVEWKRVDMLLRAFEQVKKKFTKAELLIIGAGPEEKALKNLANSLDLGSGVEFLGGVYDPRLLGQYYMASSLYVLAGMGGLSINDAMCFGLPILCSVGDGTEKILVREDVNGKYFCDGNEEDLADKISWFFDHPEKLQQMGKESVKIIHNEVNIHTVIKGYMTALQYVYGARCL